MVLLSCAMMEPVGKRGTFPVVSDELRTVGELKLIIVEMLKYSRVDKLHLYLAKVGQGWLSEDDVDDVPLDEDGHPISYERVKSTFKLSGYFGENFVAEAGDIHGT
ncbi:hypothetical protein PHYSODRAFT_326802 [Phytophthora sojae]|uniref:Crinkler effector protein N-terminal domain-containing protein n=1 Tax=Phytophthora sojae (strain P6497) TaxID=1094619 RepID=G4Z0I6_PHYSP|nr:hypothetical protein PHYSODRAFT_326802 [Phytophthora sojae]EGZ25835.1 hypothetical protein PHYSODRAFT_326802 [Phytophthora sojae]|eukprot:XP_009521123.1 hypothetical protein PHYSODRAFT_326802 [Phytophthora sojae]